MSGFSADISKRNSNSARTGDVNGLRAAFPAKPSLLTLGMKRILSRLQLGDQDIVATHGLRVSDDAGEFLEMSNLLINLDALVAHDGHRIRAGNHGKTRLESAFRLAFISRKIKCAV